MSDYAGMSIERLEKLTADGKETALTTGERAVGWHFCHTAWDGLLISPVDMEYKFCACPAQQQYKRSTQYYTQLENYGNWLNNNGDGRHYPNDFKNLPKF